MSLVRLIASFVAAAVLTGIAMRVVFFGLAVVKSIIWLLIFATIFYTVNNLLQKGSTSSDRQS